MEEKKLYYLYDEERLLDYPYRLIAIGWMPHHIHFHKNANLKCSFVCISSNMESAGCHIRNGVEINSEPNRLPHFGMLKPGTRIHTIKASYHDEIFFMYPAETYEDLLKLFQCSEDESSFSFSAIPEDIVIEIRKELLNLNSPGTADRLDQLAIRLFSEIILRRRINDGKTDTPSIKLHTIAAELKRGVPLQHLLKEFGYSERTFYREWKKICDVPPNEYRIQAMLHTACTLLAEGGMTHGEIAQVCRFDNMSYFYQQFRKRIGMTPGAYRKKHKHNIFPAEQKAQTDED